jgi:hypothetical protein
MGYRYPCFDCHKTFSSRSGTDKHFKSKGHRCKPFHWTDEEREQQLGNKNESYQLARADLLRQDACIDSLPEILPEYKRFMDNKTMKQSREVRRSRSSPSTQLPLPSQPSTSAATPQRQATSSRSTRTSLRFEPYGLPKQMVMNSGMSLPPGNESVDHPAPVPSSLHSFQEDILSWPYFTGMEPATATYMLGWPDSTAPPGVREKPSRWTQDHNLANEDVGLGFPSLVSQFVPTDPPTLLDIPPVNTSPAVSQDDDIFSFFLQDGDKLHVDSTALPEAAWEDFFGQLQETISNYSHHCMESVARDNLVVTSPFPLHPY